MGAVLSSESRRPSRDAAYEVEKCHTKNLHFPYLGLDFNWRLYYNGHCE